MDALLNVCFEHAKRRLMPLHCHLERTKQALRGVEIENDALADLERLRHVPRRLRIEREIEHQFFGRP